MTPAACERFLSVVCVLCKKIVVIKLFDTWMFSFPEQHRNTTSEVTVVHCGRVDDQLIRHASLIGSGLVFNS